MGLKPHLTPKRREWLQRLADNGPLEWNGGNGNTRFHCMKLGWTEWWCRNDKTGDSAPASSLPIDPQARWLAGWRFTDQEVITQAGKRALDQGPTP